MSFSGTRGLFSTWYRRGLVWVQILGLETRNFTKLPLQHEVSGCAGDLHRGGYIYRHFCWFVTSYLRQVSVYIWLGIYMAQRLYLVVAELFENTVQHAGDTYNRTENATDGVDCSHDLEEHKPRVK